MTLCYYKGALGMVTPVATTEVAPVTMEVTPVATELPTNSSDPDDKQCIDNCPATIIFNIDALALINDLPLTHDADITMPFGGFAMVTLFPKPIVCTGIPSQLK